MVLNAAGICSILEASALAGVRVLKFAGLEVEFGPKAEPLPLAYRYPPSAEITEPNHEKQSRESVEMDELMLRENRIQDLLLEDPLQAEQLIADGELADDDRANEDHEA